MQNKIISITDSSFDAFLYFFSFRFVQASYHGAQWAKIDILFRNTIKNWIIEFQGQGCYFWSHSNFRKQGDVIHKLVINLIFQWYFYNDTEKYFEQNVEGACPLCNIKINIRTIYGQNSKSEYTVCSFSYVLLSN